jgi:hypothetical protein
MALVGKNSEKNNQNLMQLIRRAHGLVENPDLEKRFIDYFLFLHECHPVPACGKTAALHRSLQYCWQN